ncbi:sulfotransferase family protein [Rivularia sp. PCC 7116]|uniref:sulfotransferase domain-containing protein n=1 Tax=Rivularia sp. PCC 7116 TaxID=373994 RepID=UPI00029F3EAB|nr:sulfotransferase domain-containing protein [Rivularia sp. PCC 7116]AFY56471.1 sulfotransferase family protein [Rivularia sp. PCC 7116]
MENQELSLIPRINCVPRSFDSNAPVNFYTPPFITKSGMQNVFNHFVNRDSDIYVATYPKSGTTWTISIIEHLINKVPPKGISTGASTAEACLWLDRAASVENWRSTFSQLEKMKSPRFFKSHASVGLIKQPARIIQCIRHPLDTFVSAWHHTRGKKHLFYYNGSWSHFFSEIVLQSKYEGGDWFDYHEEFLQASKAGKIDALFLRYEDMKKDNAISAIHKLAEFIGVESYDAEEISRATDFKSMKQKSITEGHIDTEGELSDVLVSREVGDKNNPSKAHIRKGMVGDWVNYLSDDELVMWRDYVNKKKDYCPHVVDFFSLDDLLCN